MKFIETLKLIGISLLCVGFVAVICTAFGSILYLGVYIIRKLMGV